MPGVIPLRGLKVAFIDQDAYYKDLADLSLAERREVNFDHPDAFDTDLLVSQLRELKEGRAIDKPVYDFQTHVRGGLAWKWEPYPSYNNWHMIWERTDGGCHNDIDESNPCGHNPPPPHHQRGRMDPRIIQRQPAPVRRRSRSASPGSIFSRTFASSTSR